MVKEAGLASSNSAAKAERPTLRAFDPEGLAGTARTKSATAERPVLRVVGRDGVSREALLPVINEAAVSKAAPLLKQQLEAAFAKHSIDFSNLGLESNKLATTGDAQQALVAISGAIKEAKLPKEAKAELRTSMVAAYARFYETAMQMSAKDAQRAARQVVNAILVGEKAITAMLQHVNANVDAKARAEEMMSIVKGSINANDASAPQVRAAA